MWSAYVQKKTFLLAANFAYSSVECKQSSFLDPLISFLSAIIFNLFSKQNASLQIWVKMNVCLQWKKVQCYTKQLQDRSP